MCKLRWKYVLYLILQLTPTFSSSQSTIQFQGPKRTSTTHLHWMPSSSAPRLPEPTPPILTETRHQSSAAQQSSSRRTPETPGRSRSTGGSSLAANGDQPETPKSCLSNEGSSRKRMRVSFAPGKHLYDFRWAANVSIFLC